MAKLKADFKCVVSFFVATMTKGLNNNIVGGDIT